MDTQQPKLPIRDAGLTNNGHSSVYRLVFFGRRRLVRRWSSNNDVNTEDQSVFRGLTQRGLRDERSSGCLERPGDHLEQRDRGRL